MSRELSPLGQLLETARATLGISGREAARRANITETRWRQVVRGTQTRAGGQQVTANPKPITVVAMALAVNADPTEALQAAGLDATPSVVSRLVAQTQTSVGADLDEDLVAEIERIKGLRMSTEHKLRMIRALIDTYVEDQEARDAGPDRRAG